MLLRFFVYATVILLGAASLAGGGTERSRIVHNRPGLAVRDEAIPAGVPDTNGAIGRRYYLETVNTHFALYNRSLRRVASREAYAFWHVSPLSRQVVDPLVVWDDGARRFYLVMIFYGRGGTNKLLFAWSKPSRRLNLSSSWCRMSMPVGTRFDDYPKLGFSRAHIVIGTNLFNQAHDDMLTARVWVLGKPRPGAGCKRLPVRKFGTPRRPLRRADGRLAFTPVPIDPVGDPRRAYVIAADCVYEQPQEEPPACGAHNRTANQLTLWHVAGSRRSPRLVRDGGIDVPVYRLPRPAPQPGTSEPIDPSDTRLYQAVSAPDPSRHSKLAIWTQHAVAGPGGRSEIRWYELDPRRLSMLRRGTIASQRNWVFSGAISPTRTGRTALLHYVESGHGLIPQLRIRVVRPAGRDVKLADSSAPYRCDFEGDPCPWGDYATATPDPREPSLVWGSNEVMGSLWMPAGPHWRTQNFAVRGR